jgi:hypothetical protein
MWKVMLTDLLQNNHANGYKNHCIQEYLMHRDLTPFDQSWNPIIIIFDALFVFKVQIKRKFQFFNDNSIKKRLF